MMRNLYWHERIPENQLVRVHFRDRSLEPWIMLATTLRLFTWDDVASVEAI